MGTCVLKSNGRKYSSKGNNYGDTRLGRKVYKLKNMRSYDDKISLKRLIAIPGGYASLEKYKRLQEK